MSLVLDIYKQRRANKKIQRPEALHRKIHANAIIIVTFFSILQLQSPVSVSPKTSLLKSDWKRTAGLFFSKKGAEYIKSKM